MPSGSRHLSVGIVFALVGAGSLMSGLLHATWLPSSFLTLTGYSVATLVGFVLLLGGMVTALFAFQRREEASEILPAEIAFVTRMTPLGPVVPIQTPGPATPGTAVHRARAGPAPPPPPVRDERIRPLDTEIRELTRKISKAGVMLATGQISKQGYIAYVDDLKRQRGELEAKRVEMEMVNHI